MALINYLGEVSTKYSISRKRTTEAIVSLTLNLGYDTLRGIRLLYAGCDAGHALSIRYIK